MVIIYYGLLVGRWGQDRRRPRATLNTYYNRLTANKSVVKNILLLVGALASLRARVAEALKGFDQFNVLWSVGKMEVLGRFQAQYPDPSMLDFEEAISKYAYAFLAKTQEA